ANPKTVTAVSEDLAITTAVVKKKYLVTITPSDHGTISIMKGGIPVTTASLVEHGSELVITASPSTNYILSSLKVNNVAITSGSSKTVTEAITVQAEFTYVAPKYAVTFVQPENGEIIVRKKVVNGSNEAYVQINSGDSIPDGTSLYIYAEPGTNYLVSNILINGIPVENKSDYPLVIEVAGATTIAAQFAIAKQMVTFTPPANGTFTVKNGDTFVNSGDLVDRGTVLTLTAYPNATYKFKMWGDENKDNPREITVGTSNLTVSALFGLITGIEQVYSGMNVYAANNAIYLNGVGTDVTSVSVVDMAGKVVYNNKPELGQTIINPVNRGIYIVVVKGKKGNVSSKVIVK
ncbi:MAG: T9SS type A sorting domain-containing protein, partial [Tannerellaceae bacterium]|nr:T9SS type A sorting domain-containing protein [Tannerellaceae bacterium]